MLKFLDLHYHADPDLFLRKHSVLSLGNKLLQLNGAVVLKSHLGSTVDQAILAQELGLPLFGSITLNKIGGGLDYRLVLSALARYKASANRPLLVYFPTIKPHNHQKPNKPKVPRILSHSCLAGIASEGESLLEGSKLKEEVREILRLARDWPIRFSTGHSSKDEIDALAEEAIANKIDRILITHPAHPCLGLSHSDLEFYSKQSLFWFELSSLTRLLGYQTEVEFNKCALLPQTIFVSDYGQTEMPDVNEWYATSHDQFEKLGLNVLHMENLFKNKALSFLGISEKTLGLYETEK